MLNSRLIHTQDAQFLTEVLGFLIQNYGRPPLPETQHMSKHFETLAWSETDTRSVFEWAEDNFVAITAACQNPYLRSTATPILYDPRNSTEPGHFAATTILQLGELRAAGFKSKMTPSALQKRMVTVMAAVYNSQGFVLAHLLRQLSAYLTTKEDRRAVSHKTVLNMLCYASCLSLRAHGETEAQIIENYGALMPDRFRRKIRAACRQINKNDEALKSLQGLNQTGSMKGRIHPLAKQMA